MTDVGMSHGMQSEKKKRSQSRQRKSRFAPLYFHANHGAFKCTGCMRKVEEVNVAVGTVNEGQAGSA